MHDNFLDIYLYLWGAVWEFLTRKTELVRLKQLKAALISATGVVYPYERNWILEFISGEAASRGIYQLPKELAKLFFVGRVDYQSEQCGFNHMYGMPFTVITKLLQTYAVELAIQRLPEQKQREIVEDKLDGWIENYKNEPVEQIISNVFEKIIENNPGTSYLPDVPSSSSNVVPEESLGPVIEFLKGLLFELKNTLPSKDFFAEIQKKYDSLTVNDPILKELLAYLIDLYDSPKKHAFFENDRSVQANIESHVAKLKKDFRGSTLRSLLKDASEF